jgi:Protein of unknown function (DUF2865)
MELFLVRFDRSRLVQLAAGALAAMTVLSAAPAVAQNENFFEMLFGRQQRPRQYVPPQASPYADPSQSSFGERPAPSSGGGGRAVAYCVRLCDGRYFPIQRHANANPAQLCSAFCPAAKTQVFNGSQIDHAYAGGGQRYADLENAFVYRQRIVEGCSCNGKDSFGLARLDVVSDPTLRPGDIVSSGDNVKAALIAMHAAKERGQAAQAAAERPALRGSRTATSEPAPRAKAPAEAPVPTEATDDIPED